MKTFRNNTSGGRSSATAEVIGSRGGQGEWKQRRLIRRADIGVQLSKTDVKYVGAKVKVNPYVARYLILITAK